MRCKVCNRGPLDGITIYRMNLGEIPAIWLCKKDGGYADQETQELINVLENKENE